MELQENLSAFLFGYTGAIGSAILKALANEPRFNKVILFGRRKIELPNEGNCDYEKFTQEVIDFDKLSEYSEKFERLNVGFWALGANPYMEKEAYRKIEFDYAMDVAQIAHENGLKHFHYVSGALANKNSWFTSAKIKGEVEDIFRGNTAIKFHRVSIYKPYTVLTEAHNGGVAGRGAVRVFRALDRVRWFSIDADVLGKFIVANCFEQSGNSSEAFTNGYMNSWGKQHK